jgi:alkylated DNA repair dioxygenase AlkB
VDLGRGAWVTYESGWLAAEAADALLRVLLEGLAWEQRPIVVAGREVMQPRLIAWGGDLPYRYSSQTLPPAPVPAALAPVLAEVSAKCGVPFNHVVLNRYRDGKDNLGFHADDEPELGRCPVIAALSLGATRRFVLERKGRRSKRNLRLGHGSLLVMGGTIQHTWYHGVPKDADCRRERINVTFRWLKGPPGWRESPPLGDPPDQPGRALVGEPRGRPLGHHQDPVAEGDQEHHVYERPHEPREEPAQLQEPEVGDRLGPPDRRE